MTPGRLLFSATKLVSAIRDQKHNARVDQHDPIRSHKHSPIVNNRGFYKLQSSIFGVHPFLHQTKERIMDVYELFFQLCDIGDADEQNRILCELRDADPIKTRELERLLQADSKPSALDLRWNANENAFTRRMRRHLSSTLRIPQKKFSNTSATDPDL